MLSVSMTARTAVSAVAAVAAVARGAVSDTTGAAGSTEGGRGAATEAVATIADPIAGSARRSGARSTRSGDPKFHAAPATATVISSAAADRHTTGEVQEDLGNTPHQ
jgi:hypothetical protein